MLLRTDAQEPLQDHQDSGKPAPIPAHRQFHETQSAGRRFTIYGEKSDRNRWRLENAQGENVGSSGEGFGNLAEAKQEVTRLRKLSASANLAWEKGA